MRLITLVILISFCIANAADWRITKTVSPIDDSISYEFYLHDDSIQKYSSFLSDGLYINCKNGQTSISIQWSDYPTFNDEIIPVIFRSNKRTAVFLDIIFLPGVNGLKFSHAVLPNNIKDYFIDTSPVDNIFYFQTNIQDNKSLHFNNKKLYFSYKIINHPEAFKACGINK